MSIPKKRPPMGFRYTGNSAGARGHLYEVECLGCGRRIGASGMGVGSHRRACQAKALAYDEWFRRYGR